MRKAQLLPALGAGFGVIRREPLSVLIWGVVALALALIPWLIILAFVGPAVVSNDPSASPAIALLQPVQLVVGLFSTVLIYGAIYRAVMRPAEKGFAFLKLGADEFHLGVTLVVLWVLMIGALIGMVVIVAIPAAIVGMAGGGVAAAGVSVLMVPILFLAALIPAVRLGMALPMTIAERRIRIFEAWTLTKGYTGSLLAMALLQFLMLMAFYIVFVVLLFILAGAAVGPAALSDPGALEAFFQNPGNWTAMAPTLGVLLLIMVALGFVITPILVAPWARAYQLIVEAKGDNSEVFA
jgi:hypothetical protein